MDVTMPQMGVSVAEGTVVEWKKQVGDWIEADEIIASISTDKIDTDVESPATGRVAEIIVNVGDTVDVGVVMARIATDARPGEAHASENGDLGTGEAAAAVEAPGAAGELLGDAERDTSQAKRYSPVVMRMAAEHNIDLSQVQGTGRGGRVSKKDVLAFMEGGAEEPPMHIESPYRPDEPAIKRKPKPRLQRVEEVPKSDTVAAPSPSGGSLSRMRQAIGSRMVQSLQTAATCTTIAEADMSRIEVARKAAKMSYLPFQARATIETLLEFPHLNATLEGDQHTVHSEAVHLGIAVSLGEGGLIVPVIRDAQDLSVEGLSKRIKDLAARARTNQLTPDEVSGGTFTITNPGPFGSIMATPVINLPQVGILDTEAVVKRPVVVTDELGNDSIAIRSMTYLCMSWDHRALDGAYAAQFLSALRKKLESWPIT
ncbi:dihydrolipoamide acetyltransferase family protein [Solirubrobacter deserti]|uniref:Dihydrolipoamide acetyltransferase component of pyruvate dehydrogenase complex n=1 Tax=Solirubrobacter deserti TaxID=2282478 RepID=A0ABT4RK77_9ACTN|nr:dihydrolipoamide acetyltransferase family protein [Solirubrobacter deserti]MDA0138948.1 2-oxo acid dehydrogenase subunit E2 [Solirubrobacter deserti]